MIKILIADDHQVLREGIRSLLEKQGNMEVIAEAPDGRTAVNLARKLNPDVIIMDIAMPDLNGIDATRQILSDSPDIKIVVLSMHSDRRFVAEMLKAGASGYLLKNSAFQQLTNAIQSVIEGRNYLCPEIGEVVIDDYVKKLSNNGMVQNSPLTAREREVLQLIAEGKSTKQVASQLNVSIKTADSHRQQLMRKLNIRSVAELTKYAIREGITPL
jgi:DNA-binding NarL/FixJ family response regulator